MVGDSTVVLVLETTRSAGDTLDFSEELAESRGGGKTLAGCSSHWENSNPAAVIADEDNAVHQSGDALAGIRFAAFADVFVPLPARPDTSCV
jgi:hypothetical protein